MEKKAAYKMLRPQSHASRILPSSGRALPLPGSVLPMMIPSRVMGGRSRSQRAFASSSASSGNTGGGGGEAIVARFSKFGRPSEVVSLQKEAVGKPAAGQVKVQMLAAPIHPADLSYVEGTYGTRPKGFPAAAGVEGVGVVWETGPGVSSLQKGDWVVQAGGSDAIEGTWRTWGLFGEKGLLKVPHDLDLEYAACLGVAPSTALRLLDDFAPLKPGDVVVQNGANSAVGQAVFQIARHRGLKTINIVRDRPEQDYSPLVERMKQYGADLVVPESITATADFARLIADLPKPRLALSLAGGPSATLLARLLGDGGTYVQYGAMGRRALQLPASLPIFRDIRVRGFWLPRWLANNGPEARLKMVSEAVRLVKEKKLRMWLERHAFTDLQHALPKAQQPFRSRKVVLIMDK